MPAPTMGGYPIVPETATMVFWTQSGHHVTVFTTNNTGAVRIDGIALSDLEAWCETRKIIFQGSQPRGFQVSWSGVLGLMHQVPR